MPLTWESHLLVLLGAHLPSVMATPSDAELAVYTVLADQSAVAVINARLAASKERTRLARELHDSGEPSAVLEVMHAGAAPLSMVKAGLDNDEPMGRAPLPTWSS